MPVALPSSESGLQAWSGMGLNRPPLWGADDFQVYHSALSQADLERIYGSGLGDFNNRSIDFVFSDELELPKPVTIRFLEDGLPVELNASSFDVSDLVVTSGSATN